MLTREVMGLFALGVLWLNTFLVAAAALVRARELAARGRKLEENGSLEPGRYGLVRGRLIAPAEGGPVATTSLEQVGRHAAGKRRAILWHDRRRISSVRGGAVDVAGVRLSLTPAEGEEAEAWLPDASVEEAARCAGPTAFDELYPTAKKARGVTRTVTASLGDGDEVWIAGRLEAEGEHRTLGPGGPGEPLVIARMNPREWAGGKTAMLVLFAPAVLLGAGLCTAVALWPPVFDGAISKAGGLLCFVYFLLVLPAGTRARDASLEPPRRFLRGRWDDPEGRPTAAPASSRAA